MAKSNNRKNTQVTFNTLNAEKKQRKGRMAFLMGIVAVIISFLALGAAIAALLLSIH